MFRAEGFEDHMTPVQNSSGSFILKAPFDCECGKVTVTADWQMYGATVESRSPELLEELVSQARVLRQQPLLGGEYRGEQPARVRLDT